MEEKMVCLNAFLCTGSQHEIFSHAIAIPFHSAHENHTFWLHMYTSKRFKRRQK